MNVRQAFRLGLNLPTSDENIKKVSSTGNENKTISQTLIGTFANFRFNRETIIGRGVYIECL